MITLTVPCDASVKAVATVVGFLTDGLDAVVIEQAASIKHPGHLTVTVTGNPRDLGIVESRSEKLGRVE